MPDYHQHLYPELTYHIFSRAKGNENIFREEKNHSFFLQYFTYIKIQFIISIVQLFQNGSGLLITY